MAESVVFDRVADVYDRTRALPDELERAQRDLLVDHLAGRRTLEVGVGTGRVARPLAAAGIEVVGIDLSIEMLRNCVGEVPVAVADGTRLPIGTGAVEAVVACHVLHLVPDWQAVLDEAARVLAPDGIVLAVRGGWGEHRRRIVGWFWDHVGARRSAVGADTIDQVVDHVRAAGWRTDALPVLSTSRELDVARYVGGLADGVYSATWSLDESTRRAAAAAAGERAADAWPDGVVTDVQEVRWWRLQPP
ncbi:class I SAM-dependent methyltransferase [Salsipaludibacter albus]|uniref:class I SAM-dependent methyltransferase n=1 Tax=Salsipaludibacter albus TaxID=2849650 RepID=UPI001EE419C2|nr:class I SAM-dependent methyltransferase [Salsipaludibacter albus]MBY5160940.1 methyltransferase domain-containing protein [Salsipaludibacter albus]